MCGVYISICVSSYVCLCACVRTPTVVVLWHKYKHFISSNLNFDLVCCCHSLCDGPIMFTLAVETLEMAAALVGIACKEKICTCAHTLYNVAA